MKQERAFKLEIADRHRRFLFPSPKVSPIRLRPPFQLRLTVTGTRPSFKSHEAGTDPQREIPVDWDRESRMARPIVFSGRYVCTYPHLIHESHLRTCPTCLQLLMLSVSFEDWKVEPHLWQREVIGKLLDGQDVIVIFVEIIG
jgi:hypothetical protein